MISLPPTHLAFVRFYQSLRADIVGEVGCAAIEIVRPTPGVVVTATAQRKVVWISAGHVVGVGERTGLRTCRDRLEVIIPYEVVETLWIVAVMIRGIFLQPGGQILQIAFAYCELTLTTGLKGFYGGIGGQPQAGSALAEAHGVVVLFQSIYE